MSKDSQSSKEAGRIGLAHVAEAAGVSKMTASRVLNGGTGFSDATRERVMDQVSRLGYVQNRLAAAFSTDTASTYVGVSIPDLGNEVFSQVLEGIERKLHSFGYQAVLSVSHYDAKSVESWIETVLSWRPAGLIITGRNHSERTRSMIKSAAVPIVEIWDLNSSPIDMCVGVSHFDSGYAMGRFMVESGHRKLGYIGTSHDMANAAQARQAGWRKAIGDGGGEVVHTHVLRDTPGFYSGFYATEQFLGHANDVDALYYQNDNMAAGGLMFCQSNGLDVPGDIGIAGWGDLPIGSVLPKRLTTIHVPHLKIGHTAAEQMVLSLTGKPHKDVVEVPYRLTPGATI